MKHTFVIGNETVEVSIEEEGGTLVVRAGESVFRAGPVSNRWATLESGGRTLRVPYHRERGHVFSAFDGHAFEARPVEEVREEAARGEGGFVPEVISPMPGKVLEIFVAPDDTVEAGAPLVLLEAMKMEQTVRAAAHARVAKVCVATGEMVGPGATLAILEIVEDGGG